MIPTIEQLEPRDAPTAFSWFVAGTPPALPLPKYTAAISDAWAAWGKVADIQATQVYADGPGVVVFDSAKIDGMGRTLAQATDGKTVTLDSAERWVVSVKRVPSSWDAERALLHEIGHIIGLNHVSTGFNIMRPLLNWGIWQLGPLDKAMAQAIYGPPK